MILRPVVGSFRGLFVSVAAMFLIVTPCNLSAQQPNPEEQAVILLNSARQAYNDRNYPVAIEGFRSCLQKFPKTATPVRYGLALALLESADKDYSAGLEALEPLTTLGDSPDRPFIHYYYALAHRGIGLKTLDQIPAKPNEAQQLRTTATQHFNQAAVSFATAADAFATRVKTPVAPDAKELPLDLEWSIRARCDRAEVLLRVANYKDALAAIDLLVKDPTLSKSRYRPQAAYQIGYACFMLKDYVSAAKSLVLLAPFENSEIGLHARYLLARAHHLADERPEAAALYNTIQGGYLVQRKAAEDVLKNPDAFKDKPEEKARLQAILSSPPPNYIARAAFYHGVLLFEQGKPADALARFTTFLQITPKSPLAPEAQLRQGFCQVQLKQFAQAIPLLQPLAEHPQLSDQALRWLARAQIGAADPTNLAAYDQAVKSAIDKLRKSADRLKSIAADPKLLGADPDARNRRGEVLLELGDVQRLAKLYKDAAATYQLILSENSAPDALEEASHGLATSVQLAGQYKDSDEACLRFQKAYPKSTLLPALAFRLAENPYLTAAAAINNPNSGLTPDQIKALYTEAIKRYQEVITRYPAYEHLSLAKQGLASAYYQLGQFEAAAKALSSIPDVERSGPLASTNYILADCLLRTLPPDGDDALSTARLLQQLEDAKNLLSTIVNSENAALAPDATIKIGYTYQRIAALTADPEERNKTLLKARGDYTRYMMPLKTHPLYPLALLENAKVTEQLGGFPAAVRELSLFQNDPLRKSPLATLAMLRMAEGLRGQRKPAEAAALLAKWRQEREADLLKDADKNNDNWVPALQFGHAMALKECAKFDEAVPLLESVAKNFPDRPEAAEVPLRIAQCRREQAVARIEAAEKALASNPNPEPVQVARNTINAARVSLNQTADLFIAEAAKLKDKPERMEQRARMIYEAAWCYRGLADAEIDAAMKKARADALKALQEKAAKNAPPGQPVPAIQTPDLPLAAIPLQPSELKARQQYQAIIATAGDSSLAIDARFELAEMCTARGEIDPAIPVLAGALKGELPPEFADRIRIRLGACYLAKVDGKAAGAVFAAILKAPKSPVMAPARYGAGEAAFLQKDYAQAVQFLLPFQDGDLYRHLPGTSDRALLRLGYAYAALNQAEPARRAFENLISRFPRSAFANEARYNMGLALQNLKQYDNAITAYTDLVTRTGSEFAARAQLGIGFCRMEQKRPQDAANAFMTAFYSYDYPDCSATALLEAARAYIELKLPREATRLLERVTKDFPNTPSAALAQKRLAEIK